MGGQIAQTCNIDFVGLKNFLHQGLDPDEQFKEHVTFLLIEIRHFTNMSLTNDSQIAWPVVVHDGHNAKAVIFPEQPPPGFLTEAAARFSDGLCCVRHGVS